jgi:hypothetical protein
MTMSTAYLRGDSIHPPAPCGRGLGGGVSGRKRARKSVVPSRYCHLGDDSSNCLNDRVEFAHYLLVRETDDAIALRLQPACADFILASRQLMTWAIDFNDQPQREAHEIDNVAIKRNLPAKTATGDPFVSDLQPKSTFGASLVVPQEFDVFVGHDVDSLLSFPEHYNERNAGVMRACRRETPPPNPLPQGEGGCSLHGSSGA